MVPAGSALAREGWPVLSSSNYLPSTAGPAFTVSYPPWFERKGLVHDYPAAPSGGPQNMLFIAEGKGRETGMPFGLAVMTLNLSPDELAMFGNSGEAYFWEALGRDMAKSGTFLGSKPMSFKGMRAAEIQVSADTGNGNLADFHAQRWVMNGSSVSILYCMFTAPKDTIAKEGTAMLGLPEVAGICTPFFDSLSY
jgi:hypothetical protein